MSPARDFGTAAAALRLARAVEDALHAGTLARAGTGGSERAGESAAPRHTAQHSTATFGRTNPPTASPGEPLSAPPPASLVAPAPRLAGPAGKPLKPKQLTAARLLLARRSITAVAAALGVHRYTVSHWQADPRFRAELRRQTAAGAAVPARPQPVPAGAAPRNTAQHGATNRCVNRQNEPTAGPRYSGAPQRAILAGLSRPPRPTTTGADPC